MPAIPSIISGGAALGSAYLGSRAASSAMKRSPEEMDALTANTALSKQMTGQGQQMFARAMPAVGNALNYYQTLMSGNRAARTAAVAPEAESTGNAYEGANSLINRSYIRGGVKDQALAENARARAGAIARLTTGVRPAAAQSAADVGTRLMSGVGPMYGGAAGMNATALQGGQRNREFGQQVGADTSGNFGALFARLMALYSPKTSIGGTAPGYNGARARTGLPA